MLKNGRTLAHPYLDLKRIEDYLMKLATDPEDFFRYLTDASRS